jgi:RNase P subunit RPR2
MVFIKLSNTVGTTVYSDRRESMKKLCWRCLIEAGGIRKRLRVTELVTRECQKCGLIARVESREKWRFPIRRIK